MATKINLDALIIREDFEAQEDNTQFQPRQTVEIRDLEHEAFFYRVLRKPDFQRETSDWTPEKTFAFVKSFLDGDLIPAIILWNSPDNHVFVIDGAHRISALISWVQNDYGDGSISRKFFDHIIPTEQLAAADATRRLMKQIGTYEDHKFAIQYPTKADPAVVERARRLASLAIQLQWVRGDARKAEASFLKINQQAVAIDKTELRLIKARKRPNGLAARAITRSGGGHKYWFGFEEDKKQQIQKLAQEIHTILFTPPLYMPIKTLDLPIAGSAYAPQTLQLIFEFVNLTNEALPEPSDDKPIGEEDSYIDKDGTKTVQFLKNAQKMAHRLSGTHHSSLGLHPAVYFYAANGRFQPTAFLAIVALFKEFEKRDFFKTFTKHRKVFEDFLLKHKNFTNDVVVARGSGRIKPLQSLYSTILDNIVKSKTEDEILEILRKDFPFLKTPSQNIDEYGPDFSSSAKSTIFIRDALKQTLKCPICQGIIHTNAITIDHIDRREDGGLGDPNNGQLTHPYCNTSIKN